MAYCRKCGTEIKGNVNYCPSCGFSRLSIDVADNRLCESHPTIVYVQSAQGPIYVKGTAKSKGLTLLLCFFLGGFGIHQFYIGNTTKGVLYLLFCWICYVTVIFSVIDFLIFLFMSEEEFHIKYDYTWN